MWSEARQRPQLLNGELFGGEGTPEAVARAALERRGAELHLDRPGFGLRLVTTRQGLAGTYLRFGQTQQVEDRVLPVFDGEIIVLISTIGARHTVRALNAEHFEEASEVKNEGTSAAASVLQRVMERVGPGRELEAPQRGVWVGERGRVRIAWRVEAPRLDSTPLHDWVLFVDDATGEVLEQRDRARHQAVTGSAYVFDMNPVASNGLAGPFSDNQDATSPALDAERRLVALPRLDGSSFTRGQWADVSTRTTSRASSMTNDFLFARNDLAFEQANVYFHLDRAQARIQSLGFTNVNNRVQVAIVDGQTDDNSYYTPSDQRLMFGTGGVDDAEDGDIVSHEYGHSIQDNQVPGFGAGGNTQAMGEGFGDFLAASFSVSFAMDGGFPIRGDPACVGDWDGTSYSTTQPPCLRRVDSPKHYPENETGEDHDDGEMWSSALWDLRNQLGGDVVDRLVFETHFLLGTRSTFFVATQSMLTADLNVNAGANQVAIRRTMIRHGLSRLLSTPADGGIASTIPVSVGPTRNANGNYLNDVDETRTLTVPGASGLVVHFTRLAFETNNNCLQSQCDNLYLTNADGDLFQVFVGPQTNVSSVAVPGDTVRLRLVSDPSQARFGYHVDRLDVLNVVDGGFLYDGGIDDLDAGRPDAGRPDAGFPDAGRPDAGVRDAGPSFDAGRPDSGFGSDAGPGLDAGPAPDGGTTVTLPAIGEEPLSPVVSRGCGCDATPASGLLGALFLWALRRRRT